MTRTRVEPPKALQSWDEADQALARIGDLQRAAEATEAEMQEKISTIKKSAAETVSPIKREIEELGRQLAAFADTHRDEMGKKKSRELNHGRMGFRKSTKLILPRGESKIARLIQTLRERGMTDCILTPPAKIDKDALKKYPPNDVVDVGASLEVTDDFWYEVEREEVQPV